MIRPWDRGLAWEAETWFLPEDHRHHVLRGKALSSLGPSQLLWKYESHPEDPDRKIEQGPPAPPAGRTPSLHSPGSRSGLPACSDPALCCCFMTST